MSTTQRKKAIRRLRDEGFQAYKDGRARCNNPYPTHSSDHQQWWLGWSGAEMEHLCDKENTA